MGVFYRSDSSEWVSKREPRPGRTAELIPEAGSNGGSCGLLGPSSYSVVHWRSRSILSQPEAPPPPELVDVETFPDMGIEHLAPGVPAPVYNSDPPTSGPHAQSPAPCGIYRRPVDDTAQLHSMKHGVVVIQYDPDLAQDQIESLEGINWSPAAEMIVAPRLNNPAPVALTAWTKRLLLDEVDTDVVVAFRQEFGNRSSEPAAQCPFQVDESR